MSTIIYIRCSTIEQTPELQLKDILSICKTENYEVIEENRSAFKDDRKRTEFNIIIDNIKKGECKHLYVWDLDRLYRNRIKLKQLFELCKAYKCKIHSYRQDWLESINQIPSPWDEIVIELLIQLVGWMAEDESKKKGDRVRMAVKKRDGKATQSKYGNRWGRKPYSKQTIGRVLELREQGLSIRNIAKQVKVYDANRNAKPISVSGVHKIVQENASKKFVKGGSS
jgi:DNA invertase Pin-like site-specific DNA recombinase